MKKHYLLRKLPAAWLGIFLFLHVEATTASAAEAKPAPPSPLSPIVFLVDGIWRGRLPGVPNSPQATIEMRFAWTANHQGLRFDSDFVRGEQHVPYTSGMYGWNPAKKQIVFWYSDSDGALHEGAVALEAGVLVQDFTITAKDGKVSSARSRLTQHGPNVFSNEILLAKDGGWQKIVEVRYERGLTAQRE